MPGPVLAELIVAAVSVIGIGLAAWWTRRKINRIYPPHN